MGGGEQRYHDHVLPCAMEGKIFTFKAFLSNVFGITYSLLSWFGAIIPGVSLSQWCDRFHVILASVHVRNAYLVIIHFWHESLPHWCSLNV